MTTEHKDHYVRNILLVAFALPLGIGIIFSSVAYLTTDYSKINMPLLAIEMVVTIIAAVISLYLLNKREMKK